MPTNGDYFEEPQERPAPPTVADIRDRFIAAGLPCTTERSGNKEKIIFTGRKCQLVFRINESGRPLTASMPQSEDYDAEFAQVVFEVFESIGWRFQR